MYIRVLEIQMLYDEHNRLMEMWQPTIIQGYDLFNTLDEIKFDFQVNDSVHVRHAESIDDRITDKDIGMVTAINRQLGIITVTYVKDNRRFDIQTYTQFVKPITKKKVKQRNLPDWW